MTAANGRILLIEDELSHATPLMYFLEQDNYTLFHAFTLGEARTILDNEQIDVILLDLSLPDGKGTEILSELPLRFAQPPKTIVLSSHNDPQDSALTIKMNAYDFFSKGVAIEVVRDKIREALADRQLENRIFIGNSGEGFVVGTSHKMQQAMAHVSRFAPLEDFSILLVGESGVGKEHFAKMVHELSPRATTGKLVVADCSAMPGELVENELFGNVKGAFTGANGSAGLVGEANGGTLFLDEIHHLPLDAQVSLLRLLSARTYRPIGSTSEKKANVRIVCATNKDLNHAVANGRFHFDLFQRIKELTIHIPPLRERLADLDELIAEFIVRANCQFKRSVKGLKPDVLRLFHSYHWAGNIRELNQVVRVATVMCDGDMIGVEHLPSEMQAMAAGNRRPSRLLEKLRPPRPRDLQHETERLQECMLRDALRRTEGNVSQAAKELAVSRDQVRYLMKKFGMDAESFKPAGSDDTDNV